MPNYIVSDTSLGSVANAIRTKGGTAGELVYPSGFIDAINTIQTGDSDFPDDGKTYLRIKITELGRMNVTLRFSQTVSHGVTIDWGDGSTVQTFSETGYVSPLHVYTEIGEYDISLAVSDGCVLGLGKSSYSACVMGPISDSNTVYCNMLKKARIGNGVPIIGAYAFSKCSGLSNVSMQNSVTSIMDYAFSECNALQEIFFPDSVISIGTRAIYSCRILSKITGMNGVATLNDGAFYSDPSLVNVTIPESVTSIGGVTFQRCYGVSEYHVKPTTPPTLTGTGAFDYMASDCIIYVPAASLAAYQTATNWVAYASRMVGE